MNVNDESNNAAPGVAQPEPNAPTQAVASALAVVHREVSDASGAAQSEPNSDASGAALSELKAQLIEERKKQVINLVMRQTDYTHEEAVAKLSQWDHNYLAVIKEYMNPNFKEKPEQVTKSTNQMIMGELRSFMDNVNRGYERRKDASERLEMRRRLMLARAEAISQNKKE